MESLSILLEGEIVMLKSMTDVERFLKREPIACVATVNLDPPDCQFAVI